MATYDFKNKETGELLEIVMKISEYDEFVKNNPHLERCILSAPGCSDPARLGFVKPAQGFRDILKHMKKKHRGSTINDF